MPGRPRDSAVAESFLDMAGRGSTDPDRDLSLYEAHHLVATGVAGPYLQLGRIVGVFRADRPPHACRLRSLCRMLLLDARLRHDLRPSGQGRRRADRREIHRASVRRDVFGLYTGLLRLRFRVDRNFRAGGDAWLALRNAASAGGRASALAGIETEDRRRCGMPQAFPL